jgi:hypothetical protein
VFNPSFRLTYAVTPPNQTTAPERRRVIAAAQSARIATLPVDALLVYDVQDEAARNGATRPFPFVPKVDPLGYAFDELDVGSLPRIVYRAVGSDDDRALCRWLERLRARRGLAVLVGAPSRRSAPPLPLPRAYALCRSRVPGLGFGGVVISERHQTSGAEDERVWAKTREGCAFFVSQTVWSAGATKRLLRDLCRRAEREGAEVPPLLLTFSPCGSPQTLEFQAWLGVEIPPNVKRELLSARDMLARSIELAADTSAEVCAFAAELGLAIGCNVESVSSRAVELDASAELVHCIHGLQRRPPVQQAMTRDARLLVAWKTSRSEPSRSTT